MEVAYSESICSQHIVLTRAKMIYEYRAPTESIPKCGKTKIEQDLAFKQQVTHILSGSGQRIFYPTFVGVQMSKVNRAIK